ncbi:ORF8 [Agrotis segetum granulovirus]|uniref:Ie-1 n=1 Tax=Agrotis segetum granulosis virus TaxID=10464 RepID=Q6QXC7_GVAS|nr:ie-1 [Agrotis segetum granulovirus]AAS82730.1 ORF8 [Agrotis segetum granulovirus]AHN92048.1 ie-1 [Agrotis segetum granulovirus]AKN63283.1 ie-1 [Agrotis segetum granulovirus]
MANFYKMDVEEDDEAARPILLETADSEYEYEEDEEEEEDEMKPQKFKKELETAAVCENVLDLSKGPVLDEIRMDLCDDFKLTDDMMDTYKWLSMYESTSTHMYVCHLDMDYVSNERFASDVYQDCYHSLYGNAYEYYVKQIKIYITVACLRYNNIDPKKFPTDMVDKKKDVSKLAYFLQCKTRNGLTLKQQLIYALHSVNLIGIPFKEIAEIHANFDSVVNNQSLKNLKSRYTWKGEEEKVKRLKENTDKGMSSVQELFKHTFHRGFMRFKKDLTLVHEDYFRLFETAVGYNKLKLTPYQDTISSIKWIFKDIVKALTDNLALLNFKTFESDEKEVREFLKLSQLNPAGDVIFHTKTKHRNREHYRLNCFRMDSVHVWVNTMVFDKNDSSKKLDLESLIKEFNWGSHHIIKAKYVYNLKLAKLHIETVKLVIRYILQRRDFSLLKYDVLHQNKLEYNYIFCST